MSANRPYIVGLTGGIACGKSMAAAHLKTLGAWIIDADEISHALTAPGGEALPAIRATFGDGVFSPDGSLDRRTLGNVVFTDEAARHALEAIIHPAVQKRTMDEIARAAEAGAEVVILNVPLLFETGMDALCDETWLMSLDEDVQTARLIARDGLTPEQAHARIASQMPLADKEARATIVIDNRKNVDRTIGELNQIYNALKRRVAR